MEKLELFKTSRKNLKDVVVRSLPQDFELSKVITVGSDRIIKGYAIVFGSRNSHGEVVVKGATLNSLNARGVGSVKNAIQFLYQHRVDEPVAKITELREDDYGLYFEAEVIKTQQGDELIEKINAGILRQLSYGFNYIWDKTEYDEATDSYILREIKLHEISIVTFSSDELAQLRSINFIDYQKLEILKEIDLQTLLKIRSINNIEVAVKNSNVTIF